MFFIILKRNFCLPPKQLKQTKEIALSSFRQYNKNPQQNFSWKELTQLQQKLVKTRIS